MTTITMFLLAIVKAQMMQEVYIENEGTCSIQAQPQQSVITLYIHCEMSYISDITFGQYNGVASRTFLGRRCFQK